MISAKAAIVVGLSAILAAIGAPPKLRASTQIAFLLAQHGEPYHVYKALFRLPELSTVDPATCAEDPQGRMACYLSEAERGDNLAKFESLEDWQKRHVHLWFVLLQGGEGKLNLELLIQRIFGQTVGRDMVDLSDLMEEDFKAIIGAAERSLEEEDLGDDEINLTFNWIDTNGDGTLSVAERAGILKGDCSAQSSDLDSCTLYVDLLEPLMPSSDMTFDAWKTEILSEGASVHEEVSRQWVF